MPEAVVRAILSLSGWYLSLGAIFAIAFHACGIGQVDPASRGASVGARVLLTPGIVALWPVLLASWARRGRSSGSEAESPRRLRTAHRVLVHVLAVLVPLGLAAALVARQGVPPSPPPAAAGR